MASTLRIVLTAFLFALVLAGCQEKQGPPAKPPATPPDVPREIQQPKGQNAPKVVPAPQQAECKGLCGVLMGPGAWTVSYCTANPNGCNVQTATNLLCSTTPAFAKECARRDACPKGTQCTTLFAGSVGPTNINAVFTPNDPGCKAPTPNGCVVTITLGANAGAFCGCDCQ